MYKPDDDQLTTAIRFGEVIRQQLVDLTAFAAAAAMRDLLALAYNEQDARRNLATHK